MPPPDELPLIEEVARRLDLITAIPGAVLKYDSNNDGVLDAEEWEMLRDLVEAEIVRERGDEDTDVDEDDDVPWSVEEELEDPHVDLPVLEVIDHRYEILREIGRGSQGKTLLARRREDAHYVAVKELSFDQLDSWKSLELFEREAKVLERIEHEHIPAFVDAFHVDVAGEPTRFFLVQSFVSGSSLDVLLARGERITEQELLGFAASVLEVLTYLHELVPPVIHRDIKPSNLIQRPDGTYALVDFGGAQIILPSDSGGSTIIGTSGYMPPEQLTGRACPGSDLYGLGATMVHLATHVAPSKLPTARLKLDWTSRANLSTPITRFIDRLIEPVVEDRFGTARDALQHVAQLRGRGVAGVGHQPALSAGDLVRHNHRRDDFVARTRSDRHLQADTRRRRQEGTAVVLDLSGEGVFHTDAAAFVIVLSILLALFASLPTGIGFGLFGLALVFYTGVKSEHESLYLYPDGSFRVVSGDQGTTRSGQIARANLDSRSIVLHTGAGEQIRVGKQAAAEVRNWAFGELSRELESQQDQRQLTDG